MRIGIDASRAVTRQRTGTEAYAFFLIQALIPLAVNAGHQICLYFNQPPPVDLFVKNSAVSHATLTFPRLWTHLRLAAELYKRPPNLFFTPAHVLPLTYFGPSVATVHDLAYHYFPEAYTPRQRAYLHWSTRHNAHRSRIVLADSHATRQDLIRFYHINPQKIEVLYPGIDPDLKPVTDQEKITAVLQKYSITSPYLLYLGTLQPRKNLPRLIDAFTASHLPHQLVLAGKPGWLSHTITQHPALATHPAVLLPGYIDEADKAALLSGASAILYPSLYEGFGFPILEAQACGTAVLCASTSSLPEVGGDAVHYVDPLDRESITQGLIQVATDAALRQKLVTAGFANAQKFSWQKSARQLLPILEKAAKNN